MPLSADVDSGMTRSTPEQVADDDHDHQGAYPQGLTMRYAFAVRSILRARHYVVTSSCRT
jgi:hypothetical protein